MSDLITTLADLMSGDQPRRIVYVSCHVPNLEAIHQYLPAVVDLAGPAKLTLVLPQGIGLLDGEWDAVLLDEWIISEGGMSADGSPLVTKPDALIYHVNHVDGSAIRYLPQNKMQFIALEDHRE